jgi:hypothetical protein
MPDLFEPAVSGTIISRLEKITPSSVAIWGKMNAAQMMAHCQMPFRNFFGEDKVKRGLMGLLFGRIAKKQILADKPFKRNLPTAPSFVIADKRELEVERLKLIAQINRFTKEGKTVEPFKHTFFGHLTQSEWSSLFYKHLDHHLQQFGV